MDKQILITEKLLGRKVSEVEKLIIKKIIDNGPYKVEPLPMKIEKEVYEGIGKKLRYFFDEDHKY